MQNLTGVAIIMGSTTEKHILTMNSIGLILWECLLLVMCFSVVRKPIPAGGTFFMSDDKKLFWAWLGLVVNTVLTCASIYYIVEDMNKVRVLWGMQGTLMTIGVLLGIYALRWGQETGHTAGYLDGMNDETPIDREGISEGLRRRIIERDAFTCSYCHGEGEPNRDPDGNVWEIDHVIPVSRGGKTHQGNLTLSCFRCNRAKGSKTPVEFRHRRNRTRLR